MNAPRKNLPFDPAWIALGFAAAVLIGAAVWLIAARGGLELQEAGQPAPVAGVPATPAIPGEPAAVATLAPASDPVAERLAALERQLEELAVRPAGDPALASRVAELSRQDGETQRAIAELRAATGAILREAGEAVDTRFGQIEAGIGAALQEADRRLDAQQQALETITTRLPPAVTALEQAAARRETALREAIETARRESSSALEAARRESEARIQALSAETARQAEEGRRATEQAVAQARQAAEQAAAEFRRRQEEAMAEASRRAEEFSAAIRNAQAESARVLGALQERLSRAEQSGARAAAVEALRAEMASGRALGPTLSRLGGEPPPELTRFADRAPPTEAQLRASFEEAVRSARNAAPPADTLTRLGTMLTIRRGEEVMVGDAAEGVIERARRALEAGELDAALDHLRGLPEVTRNAMRPWMEEAQAVAAARATLRRLGQG
ncbi:hypothetical protein [Sabulicella glaciei]|uniref:Inner membrane protein n=1 Tax=Sabulicella glaciei TaxID=2984948 RepID=A0ABT3NWJ3_9PROT|nr:hypothetical protein [Roseococcus sp. MDT2-1-1]MCW8086258.1 hypothetical protein [Roseococcus sp. MDT2-1-1]